jgi:hypothetical protein
MNALDFKLRSNNSIDQHFSSYETAAVAVALEAVVAVLSSYQKKMQSYRRQPTEMMSSCYHINIITHSQLKLEQFLPLC